MVMVTNHFHSTLGSVAHAHRQAVDRLAGFVEVGHDVAVGGVHRSSSLVNGPGDSPTSKPQPQATT
jgi:hypothetical protein